jgi:hypothetical protein
VSGITVIVVPTWAVWLIGGLAVANIVMQAYKIVLLRRLDLMSYSGDTP